jgi:hypothetical protein
MKMKIILFVKKSILGQLQYLEKAATIISFDEPIKI